MARLASGLSGLATDLGADVVFPGYRVDPIPV